MKPRAGPAHQERDRWSRRLISAASAVLADTPLLSTWPVDEPAAAAFIRDFADERGHRRAVDPCLLALMLGMPHLAAGPRATTSTSGPSLDLELWRRLCEGSDPSSLIAADRGPLIPDPSEAIETATETELSALHALWRHAIVRSEDRLRARCLDAARWLIDVLQPDNATCHPWAIAVFVQFWLTTGNAAARLYAETLEHNSLIALGRPDRFSAVLLLDSGRLLAEDHAG